MRAGVCALLALVALLPRAFTTFAGVTYCPRRREVSPCTCLWGVDSPATLQLFCEKVGSYKEVFAALGGRFPPGTPAHISVAHSNVTDLNEAEVKIADLGLQVSKLMLNFNNLSELNDVVFSGLGNTGYLSLADNELRSVPRNVLRHMPNLKTLDMGRDKISSLSATDLQDVPYIQFLMIGNNNIVTVEKDALPLHLRQLHIGLNRLTTLNGTIRHMRNLEWLFINSNKLVTMEDELPTNSVNLTLINAANNKLESLPRDLRSFPMLDALYFENNNIKTLNGALQKAKRLKKLNLSANNLKFLAHDDFAETVSLIQLDLGYNQLQALNGALGNMTILSSLNLTHNNFSEFSLLELRGFKKLQVVELSHNKIARLTGNTGNLIDLDTLVLELQLQYNMLETLEGALMGFHGLLKLNLSHNLIKAISQEDLIGLDSLEVLDISHNFITSLEETSGTYLPALQKLFASYNKIYMLEKDFHGLPVLCFADLSHNKIVSVNVQLIARSTCKIHSVPGTFKIYLHGNPVLCDGVFTDLNKYMAQWHVKFYGDCTNPKTPDAFSPTVVVPSLLNDIMPSLTLKSEIKVVPLDHHTNPKNKPFAGYDNVVDDLVLGKSGELPIFVMHPITLPPPTTAATKHQKVYHQNK